MKVNYFQIREIANNWASAYNIGIRNIEDCAHGFLIHTEAFELSLDNLLDLSRALADYGTTIESVMTSAISLRLTIVVFK